jgi:hypothetical protein
MSERETKIENKNLLLAIMGIVLNALQRRKKKRRKKLDRTTTRQENANVL